MERDRIRRGGTETPHGYRFEISGGHPALDFANTLDLRAEPETRELLVDYGRLLEWSEQAGVLGGADVAALRRQARKHPRRAAAARKRAVKAREAVFDVFHAAASGREIPAAARRAFEALVREAKSRLRLSAAAGGVRWQWADAADPLRPVWEVALAAEALLTSPRLSRVRLCDGDPCQWLFLDGSRKGNRRWCDMTVCGNREKARRHYQRVRASRS